MAFEKKKIGDKVYVLKDGEIKILTIDGIRFPKDRPDMINIFVGGEQPLLFHKNAKDDINHLRKREAPEYKYYSSLQGAQRRKKLDIQLLIYEEMRAILPRLRRLKKLHGGDLSTVRKRIDELLIRAEKEELKS